jgi:hypothetical protein
MPARATPQLALDERAINHADLEAALKRRMRAQDDKAEAQTVFQTADDEVKGYLAKIDLPVDSAIRVGEFRITKTHREGQPVSFERKASDRISIAHVAAETPAPDESRVSRRKKAPDEADADLRPTGEVNADALRGIADRSSTDDAPTPINRRNGRVPPPAPPTH